MGQAPFLRLLIPVISGILYFKFISPSFNLFFIGVIGLFILLISFFIPQKHDYTLRWFFGTGFMLFLFSLTVQFCQYRDTLVSFDFPKQSTLFIGEIVDLPQPKRRSVACEVHLTHPTDKKIMLYLETDTNCQLLQPGDQIAFHTQIKPFKNLGNPDEFDYQSFMHNKGFSGSAYTNSSYWSKTGHQSNSLRSRALRVRAKVLNVYKSFGLSDDEYAFISAITLGYKADLSDDLKDAFRASGTSHVLAVSGLHVGIVYIVILSLFYFLGSRGRVFFIKQILILLCLWGYVFITGMPVSVVRAAIMLSLLSVGSMFNKKGLTYNTLTVAAFFTLIINPSYLFDVGFLLSFVAVLSILFFQPKLSKLYIPKYKVSNYIWNILTVSFAAQLGVFPLVLYYFGTFPTYFFITNLLVLPFIGTIIYSSVSLVLLSLFSFLNLHFLQVVINIIIICMQFLIKSVLQIVYFFETLPMAVLEGHHISALQLFLIFASLLSLTLFILRKRANLLISFLMSIVFLLASNTFDIFKQPVNEFIIYNNYNKPEMGYRINGRKIALPINSNQTISHPSARIVLLTENSYKSKISNQVLPVDFLILTTDNSFSMLELITFFQPMEVIIDSSIAGYSADKLKRECEKLNVSFHDISDSGSFSVNF